MDVLKSVCLQSTPPSLLTHHGLFLISLILAYPWVRPRTKSIATHATPVGTAVLCAVRIYHHTFGRNFKEWNKATLIQNFWPAEVTFPLSLLFHVDGGASCPPPSVRSLVFPFPIYTGPLLVY